MRLLVRCILALSVVVLGVTSMMGDAPSVRANLEHCDNPVPMFTEFGGSDFSGWCPPEYSTCEDQDGDGCIDIGGGGGGGGGWIPPADCGAPLGAPFVVEGWSVTDHGLCSTVTLCRDVRNFINQHTPQNSWFRGYCWNAADEPGTAGRHLVIATQVTCGGDESESLTGVWQVVDEGRCDSVATCQTLRDRFNAAVDDAETTPRVSCWQSLTAPGSSGQHMVLAVRIFCAVPGSPSSVGEWTVSDAGRCTTSRACTTRRDMLNRGRPDGAGEARAYCWRSASAPETSGQHLVIASRGTPTTTTTTTTTTTVPPITIPPTTTTTTSTVPPITRPPRGGGELPEIELVS